MTRRQELFLYAGLIALIMTAAGGKAFLSMGPTCCERAAGADVIWNTVEPPEDGTSGFGGLVWAKTRNGIQLRFGYTLAEGTPWVPLIAPAGTADSRQAASLRRLFGGDQ